MPDSSAAEETAEQPGVTPPEVAMPELPPIPDGPLPSVSGMIEQNENVAFDSHNTVQPASPTPGETVPAYEEGNEETDVASTSQTGDETMAPAAADAEPVTAMVAAE